MFWWWLDIICLSSSLKIRSSTCELFYTEGEPATARQIYIYIRFYGRNRETYHFDVGDQRVFRWWNYRRVVFARKLSEKTIRYMFSIPWHAMHRVRWIRMQFSYFRFVSRKKWGFCFSEGSKGSFPDHHRSRALCSEPPNPIYCIKGFGVPC